MQKTVYIIIPVHNRKAITLNCLKTLKKNGNIDRYQVIVVDDGSTDGTKEAIHSLYPEVIVLEGNGDLWWTGAIAKGMKYAYEQGAEYFIWLNDDCLPDDDTLPKLIEFLQNNPHSIAAPSCYEQQDKLLIQKHNGAKGKISCAANPGEIIEVDSLSGWCVGLSVETIDNIGFPDAKKFPHYCGDDMYIFRANRAGFKIYLIGDIQAILVGSVHETLGLKKYFRPEIKLHQVLKSIFFSKKSPYRLQTKYFYFTERYGLLLGSGLFLVKLFSWLAQCAKLQLIFLLQPKLFMH
jgi:GT2 family glycosyltransferase